MTTRSGRKEVIELPEGMTLNADSLLNEWHAKKYLYPDTTCVNPDYNPPFPEEVYRERLGRIPAVMEMPYNPASSSSLSTNIADAALPVSALCSAPRNFYIPIFEEALDYYGLPLELKYLPVSESAPRANALSAALGAKRYSGTFMLAHGKTLRFEKVNSPLVARTPRPHQVVVGCRQAYLRDLYKIYGDWNLVIAAWNAGPTKINKAIHRARWRTRLLDHLSLFAAGNARLCASLHRGQLHHDVLL